MANTQLKSPATHVQFIASGANHLFTKLVTAENCSSPLCVILPPLGEEMLVCRTLISRLMHVLAAQGTPSLTADLSGTGESTALSCDVSIDNWRNDLAAIFSLAAKVSGDRIVILGVRHGSLLVNLLSDTVLVRCDAIAFLEPVFHGAQFLRDYELHVKARQLRYEATPKMSSDLASIKESTLSASLQQELGRIEMTRIDLSSKIMITARQTRLNQKNVGRFYASQHIPDRDRVQYIKASQFWIHEQASETTSVIENTANSIMAAICSAPKEKLDATCFQTAPRPPLEAAHCVRNLTNDRELICIEHPANRQPSKGQVLILQGGDFCRAGAYRVLVRLARNLASGGFDVFRFDYTGVGDSRPTETSWVNREADVLEVEKKLLAPLRTNGQCLTLVGICDGASLALHTQKKLTESTGCVLINTWLDEDYVPPLSLLWHYHSKRSLVRALKKRASFAVTSVKTNPVDELVRSNASKNTPRGPSTEHDRQLEQDLVSCNRPLVVVTGQQDLTGLAFLERVRQWKKSRPREAAAIRTRTVKEADHTFTQDKALLELSAVILSEIPYVSRHH